MPTDAVNLQQWAIVSHAGSLTDQHQDYGLNTYMYIREGVKIWGIIEYMFEEFFEDREDFFDAWTKIFESKRLSRDGKGFVMFLEKGELL
jgi:hypothetical protein